MKPSVTPTSAWFAPSELGALADFWTVYETSYEAIRDAALRFAADDPELGVALQRMVADPSSPQMLAGVPLLRRAMAGDWALYEEHLRARGHAFAELGVGFSAWCSLASAFTRELIPLLVDAYVAEPARLAAALTAMQVFVDRLVATVGEEYIGTKEAIARHGKARFRALIERSSELIALISVDGTMVYMSPGVERVLGRRDVDQIGKSAFELLHPDDHAQVAAAIARLVEDPTKTQVIEMRALHADGSFRWMEATGSNLLADPAVEAIVVNSRDITERKEAEKALRSAEEQLRQAQKMEAIGSLAGGVAHDFNNILSVILGYTGIMLDELKVGDPHYADIGEVQVAAQRATGLTQQLLAFSRQQVIRTSILDLGTVLMGIENMIRRLLGQAIEMTVEAAPKLWKVKADAGQIEQILMNLAVNARDAMPSGGKLHIALRNVEIGEDEARRTHGVVAGAYVVLSVRDTGTGMDDATRARMLEPFFTTKERGKGTGLGLSTVFGIVRQSGGHLSVASALGRGSTFDVYLPRTSDGPSMSRTSPPGGINVRGRETVLLVEDEEQVRAVAATILRRSGYEVIEARNGAEALQLCSEHGARIRLLLTDVVMPVMSGRELVERVAKVLPEAKVLFMSGYTDDSSVMSGEIPFLQKPIAPTVLLKKVREVLDA